MAKCKTTRRKRPKRPSSPTKNAIDSDSDLAELAAVIAEYQLDNNAYGWFRLPWRDGWNAIGLALDIWTPKAGFEHFVTTQEANVAKWLRNAIQLKLSTANLYHQATEDITTLAKTAFLLEEKMLVAALRCYQLHVSHSSGGGYVYNDALRRGFEGFDVTFGKHNAPEKIMEWRCQDAIGTTVQLQGDLNDRTRRAFRTAWNRGLYLAAYALPPAINFSAGLTVVKTVNP